MRMAKVVLMGCAALSLLACTGVTGETLGFQDDFAAALNPRWEWPIGRIDGVKVEDGRLCMPSVNASIWGSKSGTVGLVAVNATQDFKDQMFSEGIGTEVMMDADHEDTKVPQGGLIWFYDKDNYIKFAKENWRFSAITNADGSIESRVLLVASEQNGVPEVLAIVKYLPKKVWIRLQVTDGKIRALYKEQESQPWIALVEVSPLPRNEKPLYTGLFSMYYNSQRYCFFDDFKLVKNAPGFEAPPQSPEIVSLKSVAGNSIDVQWAAHAGKTFVSQNLERCDKEFSGSHGRTDYIVGRNLPANQSAYRDAGLVPNGIQYYRMVTFHSLDRVLYSRSVSQTAKP